METFTHFIQDAEYANQQAKLWRQMGHTVKTQKETTGVTLVISYVKNRFKKRPKN